MHIIIDYLPLFPCPHFPSFQHTRTPYPPKQLLTAAVWGAGHSWCSSLFPSSLVHPYLSHGTPFHPMSNCLWKWLGVLCGAGFIVSPHPSSLSTHLPFVSLSHPPLVILLWWWQPLPGVAFVLCHYCHHCSCLFTVLVVPSSLLSQLTQSLTAVLGSCWHCGGFGGGIMVFLLNCKEGVIVSVVPMINGPC
jgi:hypothetical protein